MTTLDCPHCAGPLPVTPEDFKRGVPLACGACGKQTDTNVWVPYYELLLKRPELFLRKEEVDS